MGVWKHVVWMGALLWALGGCGGSSTSDGPDATGPDGGSDVGAPDGSDGTTPDGNGAGDAHAPDVGAPDSGAPGDIQQPDSGETPPGGAAPTSLYIEMSQADLDELYKREVTNNDRLDAQVYVGKPGGAGLDVKGLRFRGASTRHYPKKSFNIKLNERPELKEYPNFNFRSERREAGNRLALNAMWTDPTSMRETLNLGMHRDLGLPAPGTYYADVYLNEHFEGLYLGLERVDREALKGWGLEREEGNFTMVRDESRENQDLPEIKERSIFGADIDAIASSEAERVALLKKIFRFRGDAEDMNWSAVLKLIRWVYATGEGDKWAAELGDYIDVEQFIDFLAIHALTLDRDAFDNDYWLYRDETQGDEARWIFIPWDMDMTFGAHWFEGFDSQNDFFAYDLPLVSPLGNDLVTKTFQTAELRQRLFERLESLMEGKFKVEYFRDRLATLKPLIADSMAKTPAGDAFLVHPRQNYAEEDYWEERLDSLIDFIELRYRYIERYIQRDAGRVEGEAYHATKKLSGAKAGDIIFLTDPEGWTIARLELDQSVDDAEISARVAQRAGVKGVDRVWDFKTQGAPVSGELSLYYRNAPSENWFEELEALGRQPQLVIVELGDDASPRAYSTRVNPFSNRAQAQLELKEEQRFMLTYPDE